MLRMLRTCPAIDNISRGQFRARRTWCRNYKYGYVVSLMLFSHTPVSTTITIGHSSSLIIESLSRSARVSNVVKWSYFFKWSWHPGSHPSKHHPHRFTIYDRAFEYVFVLPFIINGRRRFTRKVLAVAAQNKLNYAIVVVSILMNLIYTLQVMSLQASDMFTMIVAHSDVTNHGE
jgi:hypothetical protein